MDDSQKRHERILIVEDTVGARNIAERILTSLGYRIRSASDAKEALEILDSDDRFEMLFTDIIMPGNLNGIDLARIVARKLPAIKILLTSGFSTITGDDVNELSAYYVAKPYRNVELAKLIRDIFDKD